MKNILNYIKEKGDKTFKELEFNNLDSAIFSLLSYIDFTDTLDKEISLNDALTRFLLYKEKNAFYKNGFFQDDLEKLVNTLLDRNRYKDIIVEDYVYKLNNNEQFGVLVLRFDNKKYISFEGTDDKLVGWEEDLTFGYNELSASDNDAIKYLKKAISLFDKEVYVGGHSKGGRLAIVSTMYLPNIKKNKVKNIYNFDGPGLLNKMFESKEFKSIEDKIVHIIPNYSIVGLLLRHNNNYKVAKSRRIDIYSHSIFTWEINNNDFLYTSLSNVSKKLDISILEWLEEHTEDEMRIMTKSFFNIFRDNNIDSVVDLFKIKNIYKILNNSSKYGDDMAKIIRHFLEFNIKSIFK